MRLSQIGIISSRTSYSTEYQEVLAKGTADAATLPSTGQRFYENRLLKRLVDGGIYAKRDIIYNFCTDGDQDYACINWKTPALYKATRVNSPTFTSKNGFTGNGTDMYLTTNYDLDTNNVTYQLDDASVSIATNEGGGESNKALFGSIRSTGGRTHIQTFNGTNRIFSLNSSVNVTTDALVTSNCFLQAVRNNSANITVFQNRTKVLDAIPLPSTLIPPLSNGAFVLGSNENGVPQLRTVMTVRYLSIGGALTDTEAQEEYDAWNEYYNDVALLSGATLIGFGDSNTSADNPWIDRLATSRNLSKYKLGIGGSCISDSVGPALRIQGAAITRYNQQLIIEKPSTKQWRVGFLYGTNDVALSVNIDTFETQYNEVIEGLLTAGYDPSDIFLASIPYQRAGVSATALTNYSARIESVATANGVNYVPVLESMRDDPDKDDDGYFFVGAADPVHFVANGHALVAGYFETAGM